MTRFSVQMKMKRQYLRRRRQATTIQILGVCVILVVGSVDLILFALAFHSRLPISGPDQATILSRAFVIQLLLVFTLVFFGGTKIWKLGNLEAKRLGDIPPRCVEARNCNEVLIRGSSQSDCGQSDELLRSAQVEQTPKVDPIWLIDDH